MAELKKCAIKKAIRSIEKSYDYHSYNGKYDVLVDLDELVDLIVGMSMPTTTEAEIRAKAIDRFLTEMLNEFDSRNADIEEHTGSYVVSRLHAVAEQLKEE